MGGYSRDSQVEKQLELQPAGMLEREEGSLERGSMCRESVWTLDWMGLCRQMSSHELRPVQFQTQQFYRNEN